MGTFPTIPGLPEPGSGDPGLEQELEQARLRQIQMQTGLEARMLKQSKGPSKFRKVLGAITGVAASVVNPGLGSAIGNMIMGGNRPALPGVGSLGGLGSAGTAGGIDPLTGAFAGSSMPGTSPVDQYVAESMKHNQDELAELASMPRGIDPVAVLALTEKTNQESEILQATSAVAKSKHEAAMAAIQNIKD